MDKKAEFISGPWELNVPKEDFTIVENDACFKVLNAPDHNYFGFVVDNWVHAGPKRDDNLFRTSKLLEKSKHLFYFVDRALNGTLRDKDVEEIEKVIDYIREVDVE